MRPFTLSNFAQLIGENALVTLSSPPLFCDVRLPIRLLLVKTGQIQDIDFSRLSDRWHLMFRENDVIAIHDTGFVNVIFDTVYKPIVEVVHNDNTRHIVMEIKKRLGDRLAMGIVDELIDRIEWLTEVNIALAGKFAADSDHRVDDELYFDCLNRAIETVATPETLKELL